MTLLKKIKIFFLFKIWARFRINFYPSYYSSHSQFGEDMAIRAAIGNATKGFYIDIGAHHPFFYSNTYHFYQKGWRGINIDAAPGSMDLFRLMRPEDINIEACIGPLANADVDFFIFDQPALNTFDHQMAKKAKEKNTLLQTCKLKTKTLENCLEENVPAGTPIDFLSIDVEGMDELILRSNNWNKFKPKFIIFESHDLNLDNFQNHSLIIFLKSIGYSLIGKTGPSFIVEYKIK